jgi:hypothetical protein
LSVVRTDEKSLPEALIGFCRTALAGEGSVAVIAADEQIAHFRDALAAAGLLPMLPVAAAGVGHADTKLP